MAEVASVFQTVQIGVESTKGTGVAAGKKLLATSIVPKITLETNEFRALGNKFKSLVVPGKEHTVAKIEGVAAYNDLSYLLSGLINYAAPAQQGGTTAYLWTFNPDTDGPDTTKAFTVEKGSSVRAQKFAYGQMTMLELAFSRSSIDVTGEMMGKALQDGITMTATPTEIALKPVLPTQVDLYLADTQAGLGGASAMGRGLSVVWHLGNKVGPVFPLATAPGTGFAADVELEPELTVKLKAAADSEGMGLLTNMRAGSTKFLRIKAVGELIASTYYYTLQIDTALKFGEPSDFSDEDGVYAIEWNGVGVHDSTWGYATQILLTNVVSAL